VGVFECVSVCVCVFVSGSVYVCLFVWACTVGSGKDSCLQDWARVIDREFRAGLHKSKPLKLQPQARANNSFFKIGKNIFV
jgi:hypothetical protein